MWLRSLTVQGPRQKDVGLGTYIATSRDMLEIDFGTTLRLNTAIVRLLIQNLDLEQREEKQE